MTSSEQSANYGGLAGADAICQKLASAIGAGNRTWRAYLSTQERPGQPAVNARDRIGKGPWHNVKGVQIAANVDDLHGDIERDRNYLFNETALDEKGNQIPGRIRKQGEPNRHDILTGSTSRGLAYPPGEDFTCNNWTSDGPGKARQGHSDRAGGGGKLYCFAAN